MSHVCLSLSLSCCLLSISLLSLSLSVSLLPSSCVSLSLCVSFVSGSVISASWCVCHYISSTSISCAMPCVCAQSCLTLCDPMNSSPPGSSVHEILQARILEWVAIPFSRGSSNPGIEPSFLASPALAGGFFTAVPRGKPRLSLSLCLSMSLSRILFPLLP